MWITVLELNLQTTEHIVNKMFINKRGDLATRANLWIVEWKTRIFHRQKVEKDFFLFFTDLSTPNQYLGGTGVNSFPLPNRHHGTEKYRLRGLRDGG